MSGPTSLESLKLFAKGSMEVALPMLCTLTLRVMQTRVDCPALMSLKATQMKVGFMMGILRWQGHGGSSEEVIVCGCGLCLAYCLVASNHLTRQPSFLRCLTCYPLAGCNGDAPLTRDGSDRADPVVGDDLRLNVEDNASLGAVECLRCDTPASNGSSEAGAASSVLAYLSVCPT